MNALSYSQSFSQNFTQEMRRLLLPWSFALMLPMPMLLATGEALMTGACQADDASAGEGG